MKLGLRNIFYFSHLNKRHDILSIYQIKKCCNFATASNSYSNFAYKIRGENDSR